MGSVFRTFGFLPLMYLINHLWLKSKCEAVVEGMGGIVSLHGDKSRGRLRQELTEIEALVHYNFPPLASRACEVLIEEVLNHYFTGPDGKQRPWHFEHATADQERRALFARRSKVMRRHDEAEVKLRLHIQTTQDAEAALAAVPWATFIRDQKVNGFLKFSFHHHIASYTYSEWFDTQ